MEQAELFDVWQRNKGRPQFVRQYREDFAEHLSETTAGHLPAPDASTAEYRAFLTDYAAQVTRQLNPENGESDTDADAEGGE